MLLHPLEDANVGEAEGASALEGHADDRAGDGQGGGIGGWTARLLALCGNSKKNGCKESCNRLAGHGAPHGESP
jgi:hypothetical protein